ncbi:MAG: metallophosphoesterase [Deltaproteobacteria bacterium]|jgi:3',5'-cyclic AMP phosphodiesterase CpdA|nr:metallophosphoesterase [Deltaproteobacteria bacterium]
MLIGQISDTHVLANRNLASGQADTSLALEALEDWLFNLEPKLDALVMTGDLADRGQTQAYAFIRKLFSRWQVPVLALPGNHDRRAEFLAELGPFCLAQSPGNLTYSYILGDLKLIMLDTVREGEHNGYLGPEAISLLKEELLRKAKETTIVFSHHPPFLSGLGALDEPFEGQDAFLSLLANLPSNQSTNLTLASGHLHRGLTTNLRLNGNLRLGAVVAPPASMPIILEIGPDGGREFFLGAPGFVLHHLDNGHLVSHFGAIPGNYPFSGPYLFS